MGDANASIPTPQPRLPRPMFGAFGALPARLGLHFVSPAALQAGLAERWTSERPLVAGPATCRGCPRPDLPENDALPAHRRRPRDVRRARRRRAHRAAARPPSCPWPSATSCSDRPHRTRCCCSCSTRGPRPARTTTPAGWRRRSATGLGHRTWPAWRSSARPAAHVGAGRGRVRRRGLPASAAVAERAVALHRIDARAAERAVASAADQWRLLDAEFEARTPSEAMRAASRQLGRGAAYALLRSVLPEADPVTPWTLARGPAPHHPLVLGAGVAAGGRRRPTWPPGPRRWPRAPGRPARRCGCSAWTRSPCRPCWPGWRRASTSARPTPRRPRRAGVLAARRRGAGPGPAGRLPSHRGGASVCVLTDHATTHARPTAARPRPGRCARVPRIGIGGPVGSGKTALVAALCRALAGELAIGVVTNDIYTTEDADFLRRAGVLPDARIRAVQTGACPHTAIRDDISANLDAVEQLEADYPGPRPGPGRERRRQPDRDLLLRPGAPADLRHRRGRRGQGAAQGRPRRHPLRPAGDQQDRPGPAGRRGPGGDGARRRARSRGEPADAVHVAGGRPGGARTWPPGCARSRSAVAGP